MKDKSKLDPNARQVRAFIFEDLTANDEGSFIEGHPAVYDQKTNIGGMFWEIIERTAFNNTDFKNVVMTVNHNLDPTPVAKSKNNNSNSTMQLTLDERGLKVKASLDIENHYEAKALYSGVKRGDIDGMSFIFYIRDEVWEDLDTDMPTRRITDIAKVVEVSAVSFPAYDGTDINARDGGCALESAKLALENARSSLPVGNKNDELAIQKQKNINKTL